MFQQLCEPLPGVYLFLPVDNFDMDICLIINIPSLLFATIVCRHFCNFFVVFTHICLHENCHMSVISFTVMHHPLLIFFVKFKTSPGLTSCLSRAPKLKAGGNRQPDFRQEDLKSIFVSQVIQI